MGFWDSIKNAAIKAKCGVGIHGGNYKLIDGETCKYSKLCPDCNRTIQKEQHKYGEENYKYDFKCTTVKSVSTVALNKKAKGMKDLLKLQSMIIAM